MTPLDVNKKQVRVTERIDKLLWKFPKASPKEVCRLLQLPYLKYRNMVSVRKNILKKFLSTKVKGRLPKPLVAAHRVEWEIEGGVPMDMLLRVRVEAGKRRPRFVDPRPVDEWYVIPNRNRQCEFHNGHVTIRVFPKSGTCRILAAHEMVFKELGDYVWEAFLKTGLSMRECDELLRKLGVSAKHRTFRVGPVTPFKIDYYKESVGIVLLADGTHPEHIEVHESWPSWIRPQLRAIATQTDAMATQTAAVTQLTEQIRLHLSVMKSMDKSSKELAKAVRSLTEILPKKKPRRKRSFKEVTLDEILCNILKHIDAE